MNNSDGYTLTPIDPRTGRPGRPVPVADPYNLYSTPDGKFSIVMAEARREINGTSHSPVIDSIPGRARGGQVGKAGTQLAGQHGRITRRRVGIQQPS